MFQKVIHRNSKNQTEKHTLFLQCLCTCYVLFKDMLYFNFFPHQQQIQIVERFNTARENVVYTCSVQQGEMSSL